MSVDNVKIFWDEKNRVPRILDEINDMELISKEKLKYMASDLRPVFYQEKRLLRLLFDNLDEELMFKSVWVSKQGKYYIDGQALKASVTQRGKELKSEDIEEIISQLNKPIDATKYIKFENEIFNKFIEQNTSRFFEIMYSEELDNEGYPLGAIPFTRIIKEKYKDRLSMVSFSGGKDSTVVSEVVRIALKEESILHIFGDTTLEMPQTYNYIKEFQERNPLIPFFIERNEENNFFEMCKIIGPPSRVKSWCCSIFKTGAIGTLMSGFDESKLTFYGIRRIESNSRKKYPRINKTPKVENQMVASPIIDWLDIDIWLFILKEKVFVNEMYKYGYLRVGCWVCPNNSFWAEFLNWIYIREDYIKWNNFLYDFFSKMEIDNLEKYIKEGKWKARQGGAGLEISKKNSLKKDECISEINSFTYIFNKRVNDDFFNLLKPFGKIIKNESSKNYREYFILDRNNNPLFKFFIYEDENQIRLTIMDESDVNLLNRIERQINKFNNCIYCQACNSTCPANAIIVSNQKYIIDEKKCIHCKKCVMKFDSGCLVASALKIRKN
jgi:phosphoadenosine phosphosulfate reductase